MPTRRRFTVDEYYCMAEAGILHEDDRVELIEGDIIAMAAIGNRHMSCVKRLNRLFNERLGRRVVVSVQDPIRLSRRTEPQPDVALLRPRDDFYAPGHPGPDDVLLVVEVVDTSLPYDRRKLRLYARAGIPCVWLAILSSRRASAPGTDRPAPGLLQWWERVPARYSPRCWSSPRPGIRKGCPCVSCPAMPSASRSSARRCCSSPAAMTTRRTTPAPAP
jgi:Uma2 family endonuclease